MKKVALLALAFFCTTSLSFAATLQSLNKNQMLKTFEDKTITTIPLVTMHGNLVPNNTATIYFGKGGELSGHFANKPDNDPQNDQGTWQVKANGQLCVTWQNWTANKPLCVYTYKLANTVVFVNQENKFESMVLSDQIQSGKQIQA